MNRIQAELLEASAAEAKARVLQLFHPGRNDRLLQHALKTWHAAELRLVEVRRARREMELDGVEYTLPMDLSCGHQGYRGGQYCPVCGDARSNRLAKAS